VHANFHRFMDGGSLTNPTFKQRHTSFHSVLSWGIEVMVILGDQKALRSLDWLVGVETHNHCCKTLHAYDQNETTWIYQKQSYGTHCQSKCWTRCIDPQHSCQPWDWQFNLNKQCMDGAKYMSSGCEVQGPTPLHTLCMLHVWMGIAWKLCKHHVVVFFTCIKLTPKMIIHYCGRWI
jgi:hypothetical protein